jgi:hypothetical protein
VGFGGSVEPPRFASRTPRFSGLAPLRCAPPLSLKALGGSRLREKGHRITLIEERRFRKLVSRKLSA